MTGDDLDEVGRLDRAAFAGWWRGLKGSTAVLPRRTRKNLAACRERDPQGCFLAEQRDRAVGYVFSRTWGGVGWLGPVGVLPRSQGRGVGKALLRASVDYLRGAGARVIGLETMPRVPANVGFYLRQGFGADMPTLHLARQGASDGERGRRVASAASSRLGRWSQADAVTRARWLDELREATGLILPGLDYSQEVLVTAQHGLAETLVLTAAGLAAGRGVGRAVGLAVVALEGAREGTGDAPAALIALALHPRCTDAADFRLLLEAAEDFARSQGKPGLGVSVNTRHVWALSQLLGWGYQVERLMLRMVLEGTDAAPASGECVDLSRWAG
jgi:GNAT superfamily N-acetyltransferase